MMVMELMSVFRHNSREGNQLALCAAQFINPHHGAAATLDAKGMG